MRPASTCRSSSPERSPMRREGHLSGQTTEAFWNSIRHAKPAVVGLNCALGGKQMRPYIEELARIADTYVCAYPNAGLPNAFGEYDETPRETAEMLREFASSGFRQHGGRLLRHHPCAYPRDGRGAVAGLAPRSVPTHRPRLSPQRLGAAHDRCQQLVRQRR